LIKGQAKNFLEAIDTEYPLFGMGVSTGALTIAGLSLETENPFKGINLVSPCLENKGMNPGSTKEFIGQFFPNMGAIDVDLAKVYGIDDPLLLKGSLAAGFFKNLDEESYNIRMQAQ